MPRSVCIHPDNQTLVAQALERNGFLTQGDLAAHLEIALSTVSNFCRGIRVSIAKFEEISETLGLDPKSLLQSTEVGSIVEASQDAPIVTQSFFAYDACWVGRNPLIADLTAQLQNNCRLLLITGIAGMGKTALAERLSQELQHFGSVIRLNFDNQEQSTDFGSLAGKLLEQMGEVLSPDDRRDVQQLRSRLVWQLRSQPYLLIIDSLEESLQGNEQDGWSEFKDAEFLQFLQQVLAAETFASRLIATSQETPTQLIEFGTRYRNFWFRQILTGLSASEQLELFAKTGLNVEADSPDRAYLIRIGKAYEGHPLALRIITGEIGDRPFFGNVVAYWQRYGTEIEDVEQAIAAAQAGQVTGAEDQWQLDRFTRALRRNVRKRLEQTFQRLKQDAKYAYILLCESSVYRLAVPDDWWLSHLENWDCDERSQSIALDTLRDRFLIEEVIEGDRYLLRQHNLIRSVSLEHLHDLDNSL